MEIRRARQLNRVGDDVLALTAVVRPILAGLLNALKADVVAEAGGRENVKLMMIPRLYRQGDGDVGICFEYAVHEAMNNGDARVVERIADAMRMCRIESKDPKSILFGLEKSNSSQLIGTARNILTDESRLLTGGVGQPPKLLAHLNTLSSAFRERATRDALPWSIRGLWKADLFVGSVGSQQWVGTSVKINRADLESAAGLRIGIIPSRQGKNDTVRLDQRNGLIICPLHHDGDFMQVFYEGWRIVQAFLHADARVPKEAMLPRPVDREICRMLEERREFSTVEVIEALKVFSQPELIATDAGQVPQEAVIGDTKTSTLVAPMPLITG